MILDENEKAARLNEYASLFDVYIDRALRHQPPDSSPTDDPIVQYLREVASDPINVESCREDKEWHEAFKSSLIEFCRNLLESYQQQEQQWKAETDTIERFMRCNLAEKRAVWARLAKYIRNRYTEQEINLNGYVQQLRATTEDRFDTIFEALEEQWRQCAWEHLLAREEQLFQQARSHFERGIKEGWGINDFRTLLKVPSIVYRYPQLREIVDLIGRGKQKDDMLDDCTITRYLPTIVAPSVAVGDIDGVGLSSHIPSALPAELAYLSDPVCEDLFFLRYATSQLQSFSSQSPLISREKTEHTKQKTPRFVKGPIIVSVDTSSSMSGRPLAIAKALLLQLLSMAREQYRACYLITFAVRAQAIDLANYANQQTLIRFLQDGFSGGTDGNEMVAAALEALHSKRYEMADVLIISDFYWPDPVSKNMEQLRKEQALGTRFYGLNINGAAKKRPWLDRLWRVSI